MIVLDTHAWIWFVSSPAYLGAVLVTKDEKIRNYPHVKAAW